MRRRKQDEEEEEDKDKKKEEKEEAPDECVFCREQDDPENLITACHCRSQTWHYGCLANWVKHLQDLPCAACGRTYIDRRIRRGNVASRFQYYRNDPVFTTFMAIPLLFIGLALGGIYLIFNVNSFSLANLAFFEYVAIALFLLVIYGLWYAINLGDEFYRDSIRGQDVIWFLDFNGQQEVPPVNGEPVVFEYPVGQDRIKRQLGEQARMGARMEQEMALAQAQQLLQQQQLAQAQEEESDEELEFFVNPPQQELPIEEVEIEVEELPVEEPSSDEEEQW